MLAPQEDTSFATQMAPAADKVGPRGALSPVDYLTRLEQANIVNSLDNLLTFPLIAKLIEKGRIETHGAYFGVASGELYVMDEPGGAFSRVAASGPAFQTPRF